MRMTDALTTSAVRDNKDRNRFELDVDGALAFANYRLTAGASPIPKHRRRCAAAASPRHW
jgi:hypothetical protein